MKFVKLCGAHFLVINGTATRGKKCVPLLFAEIRGLKFLLSCSSCNHVKKRKLALSAALCGGVVGLTIYCDDTVDAMKSVKKVNPLLAL